MDSKNYVITIGRMPGSGGTTLGKEISAAFNFQYIDKEVLVKAAQRLDRPEEELRDMDEKTPSIWSILARTAAYEVPYVKNEWYLPTSDQLFKTQTEIMKEAVEQQSCVILGRCGSYLFRNYDKHISIFLQAQPEVRLDRLERRFEGSKSRRELKAFLEKTDRDRAIYYNKYTGLKWLDLRGYDFVLDTTNLSDEQVKSIVFHYITATFPELAGKLEQTAAPEKAPEAE